MELQDLRNKRITFFAAETLPSVSGSGLNAFHFAKYLSEYSKSVKIVSFNYNNNLISHEEVDNVEITRIQYYNKTLLTKILSLTNLLFHYVKEAFQFNICFIYGAYMPGFEIIFLLSFILRRKTIFQSTLLNDDDLKSILNRTPFLIKSLRKWMFSMASLYYAINQKFESIWKSYLGKQTPIVLLTPGFNDLIFFPFSSAKRLEARKKLEIDNDTFTILSSGIIIERKGYRSLFEELSKLSIQFIYLIAGSYTSTQYHRSSNDEVNEMDSLTEIGKQILGDKVRFLGHYQEMPLLYNVCDLYLHGGYQEGTPNSIIEAMACKKPIIMRKLQGLDYLLKNDFNVLEYENTDEINPLIKRLYTDQKLEKTLSKNSYQTVISNQTFVKIAEKVFCKL